MEKSCKICGDKFYRSDRLRQHANQCHHVNVLAVEKVKLECKVIRKTFCEYCYKDFDDNLKGRKDLWCHIGHEHLLASMYTELDFCKFHRFDDDMKEVEHNIEAYEWQNADVQDKSLKDCEKLKVENNSSKAQPIILEEKCTLEKDIMDEMSGDEMSKHEIELQDLNKGFNEVYGDISTFGVDIIDDDIFWQNVINKLNKKILLTSGVESPTPIF
jgi:hypothetical protein